MALVSHYSVLVETKVHLVLLTIDQCLPPMSLVTVFFLLIFSVGVLNSTLNNSKYVK